MTSLVLYALLIFHDGFKSESMTVIDGFTSLQGCAYAQVSVMTQAKDAGHKLDYAVCVPKRAPDEATK